MTEVTTGGGGVVAARARRTATASARLGRWAYEDDVTQIMLLDHQMVPTSEAVQDWVGDALDASPMLRAVRTGALFPAAADAFRDAGFSTIDTLALLESPLDNPDQASRRAVTSTPHGARTQRVRDHHLDEIAALDRRAFGDPWGNDTQSLRDITEATPRHRARFVAPSRAGGIGGFAITGQSGKFGYLQRLAVDPTHHRQGIAQTLLDDSMRWMRRRGATTAMVNTALDNDAALALYASAGFRRRAETLTILELSGTSLHRCAPRR